MSDNSSRLLAPRIGTNAIPGYLTGTWKADPVHSDIAFSARHLMISKIHGRFTQYDVTIVTADDVEDVAAPQVEVVDTIGAGDAFGGGFLAWLHREGHGREALADPALVRAATDYGVRVAARTCERAGAVPPTRAELPA